MRFTAIAIAAALTLGAAATSASAQQTAATFDSCSALAEARGAGAEGGRRNHLEFMRNCLAGQIPTTVGGPSLAPAPAAHVESYNKCETLAEQRGAGGDNSGRRNHNEFMRECMAGQIR